MPPIPQILDEETTNLVSHAKRRIHDIMEYQIPRLRDCAGPVATQQQLNAELRESTEKLLEEIDTLDGMVMDQKGEKRKKELGKMVKELRESYEKLKTESRAALLASKRAIDAQNKSLRDELLRSSTIPKLGATTQVTEKVTEDILMKANEDVTETLRRTLNLMQGELERSVLTNQMLTSSTATMQSASTTHDILSNLMSTSKQLITALEKADWLDRLLILSAFGFFIITVLFILKKRIIDRGIYIAFWWVRFLPNPFGGSKSTALSSTDGKTIVSAVSGTASVVASVATSVLASKGAGKLAASIANARPKPTSDTPLVFEATLTTRKAPATVTTLIQENVVVETVWAPEDTVWATEDTVVETVEFTTAYEGGNVAETITVVEVDTDTTTMSVRVVAQDKEKLQTGVLTNVTNEDGNEDSVTPSSSLVEGVEGVEGVGRMSGGTVSADVVVTAEVADETQLTVSPSVVPTDAHVSEDVVEHVEL